MKEVINLIIIELIVAIVVLSCEENSIKQSNLTGKLISNSACKSLKSANVTEETPDSLSCIEYLFEASTNKLLIKHINAGFNCCPDSLYCNISVSSDTIVVQEIEKSALCDCDCLFDLDMEINGVDIKKYYIRFIEPYSGDQEQIIFEMDLTKKKEGSYCVVRKQYPWGLSISF